MSYDLKPGDLIFCAGRKCWPSRLIALETCSFWQLLTKKWISHVRVVCRIDGKIRIAESTTLAPWPDIITGKMVSGIQVQPVESIEMYDGQCWVARLDRDMQLDGGDLIRMESMIREVAGTPYDAFGAFLAGRGWFDKGTPWWQGKLNITYCSGFCEYLLKRLNRWDWSSVRSSPAKMARVAVDEGRYGQLERIK